MYCGYGINIFFYCVSNVSYYVNNKVVGVMKKGYFFMIEFMINFGDWCDIIWFDGWIVVICDGF